MWYVNFDKREDNMPIPNRFILTMWYVNPTMLKQFYFDLIVLY